jgi:PPOX class probable F420-dependent enzyme
MTVELTQEVAERLSSDHYGWLTTVAKSGQPVPRLVWFYFDGSDVIVYSEPNAAKVRHIKNHPRVSLNLDSDGNGSGIIVVGGNATVDAEGADPLKDEQYRVKYGELAKTFGFSEEFIAAYSTRLKVSVDKVWTTPTGG